MFRIIPPAQFETSAWKNGGGITHQVARDVAAQNWAWRLSIAEVASDGPFSHFAGMARILTVISGAGIDLDLPDQTVQARPHIPVHFSGDTPIFSRLIAGAIQDFNVIYDPKRVLADVQFMSGPARFDAADLTAVYAMGVGVTAQGIAVPRGAVALGSGRVTLGAALVIRLTQRVPD